MTQLTQQTPAALGYYFPAEWEKHSATWLSWPHKEASWPGKLDTIFSVYSQFVKELTAGEQVCINVGDAAMQAQALSCLHEQQVDMQKVSFFSIK